MLISGSEDTVLSDGGTASPCSGDLIYEANIDYDWRGFVPLVARGSSVPLVARLSPVPVVARGGFVPLVARLSLVPEDSKQLLVIPKIRVTSNLNVI